MVDIDNAFLNGDLEHEIYMKIPEGYDEVINPGVDKEDCLILQKAIYGLVQAARQFWKKIVDKMQEGGFKLSEADPCMLYKEDEKGVCIIIIYIDDMLIIGKEEAIDDAIKVLQGHFQVKDPTSLEDYLGVQIVQSDDGKKAWLGQPTIIKSLEKQFGERVAKKKMTVTPGTPGFIGGKVDDISKVDDVEKSVFSIWVDLLLCRSIQLLVLSYAEMSVYMYLSQLMSTFTKLSKGASSSRWFLQSMTRRTSDSTITHMYLYTHVSQI